MGGKPDFRCSGQGAVSYTHLDVYKRQVYCLAGCQKPMKRLWISSMEDSAIRDGFAPVSYTHLQLYACLTECRFVGPLGLAAYAELSSMAASLMLGEWFD